MPMNYVLNTTIHANNLIDMIQYTQKDKQQ